MTSGPIGFEGQVDPEAVGCLASIAQVVGQRPTSPAVVDGDETVTYDQLWRRALNFAARLRAAGVVSGDTVGLCLPRSADLVVAAVGIQAAGAAYILMDPGYPPQRLRYMLQDSATRVAVAESTFAAQFAPLMTLTPSMEDSGPAGPAPESIRPDGAAYVVYTSGSTGTPKGVIVEQAGLTNLVRWHRSAFGITGNDRTALVASSGFDASVWELWPALVSGASLHVVPEPLKRDPIGLRDWIVRGAISLAFLPTPLAEAVITLEWPAESQLRYLLTGGDVLHRRPRPDLPFVLVNNYGVSEATVVSTSGVVDPAAEGGAPSIGAAITGVDLLIVDEELRPVPPGAVGELVVSGVSVARGYVGRSDAGTGRFIPDPRDPGCRAYRTGDLVRATAAGELHYVGRMDEQVQVRGIRVEPGEIAAVLTRHPSIRSSVVIADNPVTDAQLWAYVVTQEEAEPSEEELRAHLALSLPAHMIPSAFVFVDELPMSVNGKVDRAALTSSRPNASANIPLPAKPRDDVEAAIAAIVADRLGLDGVGIHDNFFLLGGHSMLGAQLITRISVDFGVEMSLRSLFENPTVAGIADEVRALLLRDILAMDDGELMRAAAHLGDGS